MSLDTEVGWHKMGDRELRKVEALREESCQAMSEKRSLCRWEWQGERIARQMSWGLGDHLRCAQYPGLQWDHH